MSPLLFCSKIQEDIEEENQKATVLSQKTKLNENVCIRCCRSFGIIFNRKQTCQLCKLYICKSCCLYDRENKGYICHTCAEARLVFFSLVQSFELCPFVTAVSLYTMFPL